MPSEVHSYQFDTVVVDVRAGRVTKGGGVVDLEPKAYDLLVLLVSRPGELLTKQDLLDAVWPGVFVTDNAIARVVAQLRRALGDSARRAQYIETVPTRGYRFVAPVEVVRSGATEGRREVAGTPPVERASDGLTAPPPSTPARPADRSHIVAIVLGLVAVGALGLAWWSQHQIGRARTLLSPRELVQLTSSPSLDAFPAWSPDGQTLAYSSDRSGTFELHVRALAVGGRREALTSDGQRNVQPDWSPDGRFIAYHSVRRGGIWIVAVDGGAARQVSPFGSRPTWSPDGRQIAFQAAPYTEPNGGAFEMFGPSSLWVVPADGGVPRQITRPWTPTGGHVRPSWFPDGVHLLFASQDVRTTYLYKVHIRTGDTTLLLDAGTRVLDPTLARDGRAAYYVRMDEHLDLWRLPLTAKQTVAGPPVLVMPPGGLDVRHVSVHPDGRQLAYTAMSTLSGLRALPLNREGLPSGPSIRLAEDAVRAARRPSIAPDASAVVFERHNAGQPPSLWRLPLTGGPASQLTPADMSAVEPSWSADGTEVHFVSDHGAVDRMWSVATATGAVRPLTALGPHPSGILRPRLSPDRQWLAYTTATDGVLDVRVRAVSGGDERVVARLGTGAAFPVWSPDSRALAFDAWTDGASRSFVIDLDGGAPVAVSPDVDQSWVRSWSPDGQRVAFAALDNGRWNVWWGTRDGTRQHRLTDYTDEHHYVRSPEWSPHGDRLIYEFATVSGNIWLVRPGGETETSPD
jgi:Tol biopolymer transport system component/DNA-binding winged helix-turn-helix (wHTH) protein